MAALAGLFLLALQAPPAGDLQGANRAGALEALTEAHVAVARVGHCTEELPAREDLEETYQHLTQRLYAASDDAEELYPGADPVSEMVVRTTGTQTPCDDASLDSYVGDAQRHLGTAEALLRADMAPRAQGLWLGTLRLCGDRVVRVEEGEPHIEGDSRPVIVHFSPAFAPRLRALTAAFVARRLPIVLDGTVVMRAMVQEPISWAISISGPETLSAEQVRRAAAAPC